MTYKSSVFKFKQLHFPYSFSPFIFFFFFFQNHFIDVNTVSQYLIRGSQHRSALAGISSCSSFKSHWIAPIAINLFIMLSSN